MKKIYIYIFAIALIGCASVRQQDLDAWVGMPIEALETHSFFITVPVYKTKTESGMEIWNYANGQEIASCFGNAFANGTNRYVNANSFSTCTSKKIVCNNIFYIRDKKIIEYKPIGRCYTDEQVQPEERFKKLITSNVVSNKTLTIQNNENIESVLDVNPNKKYENNGKRIALVIGNADYEKSPLKNSVNDAEDISNVLKQSGFEVIDKRNATLIDMTNAIRLFGDKLLHSDVGLVYFSGHGIELKGRNYLLPVNANMLREDEITFQAIDANLILEKMNTANKSVNILIVDACRDNPFARSFRSVNKGLAQMDAPTGTIVAFSTSPGKTAADGNGRNSPFTKNLVKAISKSNLPIESVFKEVRKSVVEETKGQQTPWESSSLIGDFYFKVSN